MEYDTKPTIETVLEKMDAGFSELRADISALRMHLSEEIVNLTDAVRRLDRRVGLQDTKIDIFIEEVLEMKRALKP
jgi:hypothetical protein